MCPGPLPPVRSSCASLSSALRVPVWRRPPRPAPAAAASRSPPPPSAMAAAAGDGGAKPLQSAMKLANKAIELDTGNRPRVRLGGSRKQLWEALCPWWVGEGGRVEGFGAPDARGGGGGSGTAPGDPGPGG